MIHKREGYMALNFNFIASLFPFKGLNNDIITSIFSNIEYEFRDYLKNDIVFSPQETRCEIGFIESGECTVSRIKPSGEEIPLNTLKPTQSFGILRAYDPNGEFPTKIVAAKNSKILFINGNDFKKITDTNVEIASRVIAFLINKVSFLNKKVETFSGSNTSEKLASYLLLKYRSLGNEFTISKTLISSEINVGRASLYRDLDSFCNKKLIKIEGKKIIIICPEGLERIIK
jgi:CRP-like cAMP-binding protein